MRAQALFSAKARDEIFADAEHRVISGCKVALSANNDCAKRTFVRFCQQRIIGIRVTEFN